MTKKAKKRGAGGNHLVMSKPKPIWNNNSSTNEQEQRISLQISDNNLMGVSGIRGNGYGILSNRERNLPAEVKNVVPMEVFGIRDDGYGIISNRERNLPAEVRNVVPMGVSGIIDDGYGIISKRERNLPDARNVSIISSRATHLGCLNGYQNPQNPEAARHLPAVELVQPRAVSSDVSFASQWQNSCLHQSHVPEPNSSVGNLAGMVLIYNEGSRRNYLEHGVFGIPASKRNANVVPGTMLFLFDYRKRLLYGVYMAASHPVANNVFTGVAGSKFPLQVTFSIVEHCKPLPEKDFKPTIERNYFSKEKFHPELDEEQVFMLRKLFFSDSLANNSGFCETVNPAFENDLRSEVPGQTRRQKLIEQYDRSVPKPSIDSHFRQHACEIASMTNVNETVRSSLPNFCCTNHTSCSLTYPRNYCTHLKSPDGRGRDNAIFSSMVPEHPKERNFCVHSMHGHDIRCQRDMRGLGSTVPGPVKASSADILTGQGSSTCTPTIPDHNNRRFFTGECLTSYQPYLHNADYVEPLNTVTNPYSDRNPCCEYHIQVTSGLADDLHELPHRNRNAAVDLVGKADLASDTHTLRVTLENDSPVRHTSEDLSTVQFHDDDDDDDLDDDLQESHGSMRITKRKDIIKGGRSAMSLHNSVSMKAFPEGSLRNKAKRSVFDRLGPQSGSDAKKIRAFGQSKALDTQEPSRSRFSEESDHPLNSPEPDESVEVENVRVENGRVVVGFKRKGNLEMGQEETKSMASAGAHRERISESFVRESAKNENRVQQPLGPNVKKRRRLVRPDFTPSVQGTPNTQIHGFNMVTHMGEAKDRKMGLKLFFERPNFENYKPCLETEDCSITHIAPPCPKKSFPVDNGTYQPSFESRIPSASADLHFVSDNSKQEAECCQTVIVATECLDTGNNNAEFNVSCNSRNLPAQSGVSDPIFNRQDNKTSIVGVCLKTSAGSASACEPSCSANEQISDITYQEALPVCKEGQNTSNRSTGNYPEFDSAHDFIRLETPSNIPEDHVTETRNSQTSSPAKQGPLMANKSRGQDFSSNALRNQAIYVKIDETFPVAEGFSGTHISKGTCYSAITKAHADNHEAQSTLPANESFSVLMERSKRISENNNLALTIRSDQAVDLH